MRVWPFARRGTAFGFAPGSASQFQKVGLSGRSAGTAASALRTRSARHARQQGEVQHRELERVALAVEQLRPVPSLRRPQRRVEPGIGEHEGGLGEQQVRRQHAGQRLRVRLDAELPRGRGDFAGRLRPDLPEGGKQRLAGLVLEQHQRAADHGAVAQRDHPRGDPVPLPQPLGAALLRDAHRLAAADQVAQLHGLAGHEPAHLVEADHRPAQPGDVVARGRALLPAAPAQVVVRDVAAVRQVGGEQVLEGGAPEDRGGMVPEDIGDVLHLDTCRGASLGAVPVEQRGEGAAPLLPLGPGDQPGDVVRRGQGGCLRSRADPDGPPGPPRGARAWGRRS